MMKRNIFLTAPLAATAVFLAVATFAAAQQWTPPKELPPAADVVNPFLDVSAVDQIKKGNFAVGSSDAAWSGNAITGTSGVGILTDGSVFLKNGTTNAKWYVAGGVLSLSVNGGSGAVSFASASGLLLPKEYIWTNPTVAGSLIYQDAGNVQSFEFRDASKYWRQVGYSDVFWTPDASGNITYKDGNLVLGTGLKVYGDVTAKDYYFVSGATKTPAVPRGALCGLTFANRGGGATPAHIDHKWKCVDKYPEEGCPTGWAEARFGGAGGNGGWTYDAVVCTKQ